jgi:hypothetical protein
MRIKGQHESRAREAQDPAAAPRLVELDRLVAGHAFGRAADAFADAVTAAREHNLGKARKLAAEAADHLATAERAENGLGFRAYPPPARDPLHGDL